MAPVICEPKVDDAPLKVYLPFDGNAVDATGHCNDGGVAGATATEDRAGMPNRAFLFDGVDDFIQLKQGQKYDFSRFTIALWVKPLAFPKVPTIGVLPGVPHCASAVLVTKSSGVRPDYSGNFSLKLVRCGGASYFNIDYQHAKPAAPNTNPPALQMTGARDFGATIQLNRWTHLAVTYDGASLRTFVDGKLSSTNAISGPASNAHPIRLGSKAKMKPPEEERDKPFNGAMDEVRVYDRALSVAEVAALPGQQAPSVP
ncbi:MAG: LamG domain-containing protein [Labilithrix sp.]|nr:LamG domain-containing protein [Labilithrix sp.]